MIVKSQHVSVPKEIFYTGSSFLSFFNVSGGWFSQVRMGPLMAKEMSGGTCGDREPFNLLDQILLSL